MRRDRYKDPEGVEGPLATSHRRFRSGRPTANYVTPKKRREGKNPKGEESQKRGGKGPVANTVEGRPDQVARPERSIAPGKSGRGQVEARVVLARAGGAGSPKGSARGVSQRKSATIVRKAKGEA